MSAPHLAEHMSLQPQCFCGSADVVHISLALQLIFGSLMVLESLLADHR